LDALCCFGEKLAVTDSAGNRTINDAKFCSKHLSIIPFRKFINDFEFVIYENDKSGAQWIWALFAVEVCHFAVIG
jgi:hypothetical protein